MMFKKHNQTIVTIFKIGIALKICCVLLKILTTRFNINNAFLQHAIDIISLVTLIITTAIITIELLKRFIQQHKEFLYDHQYFGFIIESMLFRVIFFALCINQKFTNKWIYYLNNISMHTHNHQGMLLLLLSTLLIILYINPLFGLNSVHFSKQGLHTIIHSHIKTFLLKVIVFLGVFIATIYPASKYLQFSEFEKFMYNSIKNIIKMNYSEFYLYARISFLVGLCIWIIQGLYFTYHLYKKPH